jgi:hypothetical protein
MLVQNWRDLITAEIKLIKLGSVSEVQSITLKTTSFLGIKKSDLTGPYGYKTIQPKY